MTAPGSVEAPVQIDVRDAMAATGRRLGPGPWHTVTQAQVDQFAESTGDHQWIHVDVERAAAGPYGGTIAHGYLTLSLAPVLCGSLVEWTHRSMGVNYGLDKVRFLTPVKVGSRIRGHLVLADIALRPDGAIVVTSDITVEVEGSDKPACVARQLALMRPADE
jgi:acyl dehydratase